MPKLRDPGEGFKGRRPDCMIINITLDQDAYDILSRNCPPHGTVNRKSNAGRFLGRLLYEHEARIQERQRIQDAIHRDLEKPTD